MLQHAHELGGLEQRIERAGVQPRVAAAEAGHRQLVPGQVRPVDVGDLDLAAGRGPEAAAISLTCSS